MNELTWKAFQIDLAQQCYGSNSHFPVVGNFGFCQIIAKDVPASALRCTLTKIIVPLLCLKKCRSISMSE